METEVEPTSAIEKSRYFNRMDEAFGILCLSISPELLFYVESCSTPNEVWKILERLFGEQDEIWQSFLFSLGHTKDPQTYAEVDGHPQWEAAMDEELFSPFFNGNLPRSSASASSKLLFENIEVQKSSSIFAADSSPVSKFAEKKTGDPIKVEPEIEFGKLTGLKSVEAMSPAAGLSSLASEPNVAISKPLKIESSSIKEGDGSSLSTPDKQSRKVIHDSVFPVSIQRKSNSSDCGRPATATERAPPVHAAIQFESRGISRNVLIHGGTLRASENFPKDRYLIELWSSTDANLNGNLNGDELATAITGIDLSAEYSYEYVTLRNLMLDANFSGGGILVINSLRTNIDSCYISHFMSSGIMVQGGHETVIHNSFLGQHITAGGRPIERQFSGVAINLMGNDNAVIDVVIFSAAVGILFSGQANIITGVQCYNNATNWSTDFGLDPSNKNCLLPKAGGPYGVCDTGQCSCPGYGTPDQFNEIQNLDVTQGCYSNLEPSCSQGSEQQHYLRIEAVDYYPNDFLEPKANVSTVEECEALCTENFSCIAAFFRNSSASCYLADGPLASLKSAPNQTYKAYLKVLNNVPWNRTVASSNTLRARTIAGIAIGSAATTLFLCLIAMLLIIQHRRKRRAKESETDEEEDDPDEMEEEAFLKTLPGLPPRFTYHDLKKPPLTSAKSWGRVGSVQCTT